MNKLTNTTRLDLSNGTLREIYGLGKLHTRINVLMHSQLSSILANVISSLGEEINGGFV